MNGQAVHRLFLPRGVLHVIDPDGDIYGLVVCGGLFVDLMRRQPVVVFLEQFLGFSAG